MKAVSSIILVTLFSSFLLGCQPEDIFEEMPESWESIFGEYDGELTMSYRDRDKPDVSENIIFNIEKGSKYIEMTFVESNYVGEETISLKIIKTTIAADENGSIVFDVVENQDYKRSRYHDGAYGLIGLNINPIYDFQEPEISIMVDLIPVPDRGIWNINVKGKKYL